MAEAQPADPIKDPLDPLAYAVERVLCNLIWIEVHARDAWDWRESKPELAAAEMAYLKQSTAEAMEHALRVRDLVLSGVGVDPAKRLPPGINEYER
jgi:hypothetical protein